MGIRTKLLDFKKRLSSGKMYSIVILLLGVVSIAGFWQYRKNMQLRQQLENQYYRAFYDMTGYVQSVESLLLKSMITTSPEKTASLLQEASRQSKMAQENLGMLPVSQNVLGNTSKFLTQVGDMSNALNVQQISGKKLSTDQYKSIESLHGFAVSLEEGLVQLQKDLTGGRLKWGQLTNSANSFFEKSSAAQNPATKSMENMGKTFQDYPKLIYDGPYSDHMMSVQPRGLTGKVLSADELKKKAIDFFGADKVQDVTQTSKDEFSPIKTYSFSVNFKNLPKEQVANLTLTTQGGSPFMLLYNRNVPNASITMDQAKELGRKFLESKGFTSMKDTYYLKEDNTAVINYAYKQGNVVVYSDLIKVKIALDNGEILGMEAKAYLAAHTKRTIPTPKISMDKAKSKINAKMNILSSDLAIIPTDFKTEIFCYEFKGNINGKDFLVYINAENGREEDVLMIVNTPNGVLTL
jgi:germination protein YpeB